MRLGRGWALVGSLAVGVGGLLAALTFLPGLWSADKGEWTTRSKAALEEFREGLDDAARGYHDEAAAHYDRALELDPKFAVARVHLMATYSADSVLFKELLAGLESAEVDSLTAREQFLVEYWRTRGRGDHGAATELLEKFLEVSPDDLFALILKCGALWEEQDWEEAEACYYRLIEMYPNQVEGYSRLGYIDMAQGHFTEAEEHLRSHLYIAPDQAPPMVALGELLVLLGRYGEAQTLLANAVELEPDACYGHTQLLRSYYLDRRFDEADAVLARLEGVRACGHWEKIGIFCNARGLIDFLRGNFEEAWSTFDEVCLESRNGFDLIGHHVAVETGRLEEARRMRARLGERIEAVRGGQARGDLRWYESLQAHFEGVEALAAGDYPRASQNLRMADERLSYWEYQKAGFKLLNRLFLAHSLELEGRQGQARAMFDRIAAVNPRFAEHLPELSFLEVK